MVERLDGAKLLSSGQPQTDQRRASGLKWVGADLAHQGHTSGVHPEAPTNVLHQYSNFISKLNQLKLHPNYTARHFSGLAKREL